MERHEASSFLLQRSQKKCNLPSLKPFAEVATAVDEARALRESLVDLLCSHPVYHYGLRVKPGHNTGQIEYFCHFASTLLDELHAWIAGCDARCPELPPLLKTLCDLYSKGKEQPVLVHNLGVLFLKNREEAMRVWLGERFEDFQLCFRIQEA